MVAFVHDQQVPRGMGHCAAIGFGIGADTGRLEELLQHVGHSQVVIDVMIRGKAFHGLVSMPRSWRSLKVESESMISSRD